MGDKEKKYAVVCGGDTYGDEWLKAKLSFFDFIIAADSGYDKCCKAGVVPDVAIGDFDSSLKVIPDTVEKITFPVKKDYTDYYLALDYCIKNGIKSVTSFGTTGGRIDHTYGALLTSAEAYRKGLDVTIITKDYDIIFVKDKATLEKTYGYVSVFPIGEDAESVTLKGFEYPLDNYFYKSTSSIGISNKIVENFGEISLKKGVLAVMIEKK